MNYCVIREDNVTSFYTQQNVNNIEHTYSSKINFLKQTLIYVKIMCYAVHVLLNIFNLNTLERFLT